MSVKRGRKRVLWHTLLWLAGVIVTLAGWTELLTKPVTSYRRDYDFGRVLHDLAVGKGIYDGLLEGWLFLFLTLIIAAFIWYVFVRTSARFNRYVETSRADLSMLQTNIYIDIEDPEMTTAWVTRQQLFHANAVDVGAYHYAHTPEYGSVDPHSFMISTTIDGDDWTKDKLIHRVAGGKGFEVTEVFRSALPTSIFATYLSDRTVLNLFRTWGWLGRVIAERYVSFKSVNEYNAKNPMYQLQLMRYRAARVRIWISFPLETAPDFEHIKAMRIRETAVHFIVPKYRPTHARKTLYFEVNDAEHERIRVTWQNKNLRRYLKQQALLASPPANPAPVASPAPPGPVPTPP